MANMSCQYSREYSIGAKLAKSLFRRNSSFLSLSNEKFLTAAESGDSEVVQKLLSSSTVDVNCVDYLGRSAVELAVSGLHYDVVEILLPQVKLACLEEALLTAIDRGSILLCQMILDHPLYRNQRVQLSHADNFYNVGVDHNAGLKARTSTVPIVLAAQRNNFLIFQLLKLRGARVIQPHDYFCLCTDCRNMREFDTMRYSRARLETYRALATPTCLALANEDPILAAFQLSCQLEKLEDVEKEYKAEYESLSQKCKNFAVDLLELCASADEIKVVLNEKYKDEDGDNNINNSCGESNCSLARVKLALKKEQKRFIAHPICQRYLADQWYRGIPWMQHHHSVIKLLLLPALIILLPFTSIGYVIAPNTKFGDVMRTPFVKFVHHTCSYVVFLFLIFVASTRSNPFVLMGCEGFFEHPGKYCLFMLIFTWILGMFAHESAQVWRGGIGDYARDWCNWIDSMLICLFLCYFAVNFVILFTLSYEATEAELEVLCSLTTPWPSNSSCQVLECEINTVIQNMSYSCNKQPDCKAIEYAVYTPKLHEPALDTMSRMQQVADVYLGYGCALAFVRVAHLLPANESLGPLLVSIGRMFRDIARFGALFFLVNMGFMCALTCLYAGHECENDHFSDLLHSFDTLFWSMFGMGNPQAYLIDERHLALGQVTTHTAHSKLLEAAGYFLYSCYMAMMVIVTMNMLIAMMSNSFQEIYNDRDVEWKFARAKLWINYFEEGFTLPTPFNLLPKPKHVTAILKLIRSRKTNKNEVVSQPSHIDTFPAVNDRLRNALQNLHREINENTNGNGSDKVKATNIGQPKRRPSSQAMTINDFFGMLSCAETTESVYKKVVQRLVQRYIFNKFLTAQKKEGQQLQCEIDVLKRKFTVKREPSESKDVNEAVNFMKNNCCDCKSNYPDCKSNCDDKKCDTDMETVTNKCENSADSLSLPKSGSTEKTELELDTISKAMSSTDTTEETQSL